MIKSMLILLLSALLCLLGACAADRPPQNNPSPLPEPAYRKITAAQAKAMMEGAEPYLLLDVRTEAEFQQTHIKGAMLIPDDALTARAEAALPDKDALILVYCRSGRRSALAARALIDMGYTNVVDFGGILDWPYETIDTRSEAGKE